MPQLSRSHLTVLIGSLALLACISGTEVLGANPAAWRYRQARVQRPGNIRPSEPQLDGDAHAEPAQQHLRSLCTDSACSVSATTNASTGDFADALAGAEPSALSPFFTATPLSTRAVPLPERCRRSSPSAGRSPPAI
jgi:hypothetical protein